MKMYTTKKCLSAVKMVPIKWWEYQSQYPYLRLQAMYYLLAFLSQ